MVEEKNTQKSPKGPKRLERHFKGVSNHRRIQILTMIAAHPDQKLYEITRQIRCDFRTASEHTRKLVNAGLLEKKYVGREVQHRLTPYGRRFVDFIEDFSKI